MQFKNKNFRMNRKDIIEVFSKAFSKMLKEDKFLFEAANQVQERTFMHRFAFALREVLLTYDEVRPAQELLSIDVEYNRDGDNVKRATQDDDKLPWIAPDILFHERGSGSYEDSDHYRNDVFCCEMKKNGRGGEADADRVMKFIQERKYQFGIDFYKFVSHSAEFDLYSTRSKVKSYRFNERHMKFVKRTK